MKKTANPFTQPRRDSIAIDLQRKAKGAHQPTLASNIAIYPRLTPSSASESLERAFKETEMIDLKNLRDDMDFRAFNDVANCDLTPVQILELIDQLEAAQKDAERYKIALVSAKQAINSMKVEAETAAQGDEQMMLEACEQISNEGLAASIAIDAAMDPQS